MTFLLSLLTNKYTWYAIGAAALAAFLYFGVYLPYEHMKAQAALVPGLQADNKSLHDQIGGADKRVAEALVNLKLSQAQRDQAVTDLGKWNDLKTGLDSKLKEMTINASASKNAVCLPSAGERELWNSTLAALTGSNAGNRPIGTAGQVPESSAGVH